MSRVKLPACPLLTIRIKKNADGSAALTLTRVDGSVTWQRQNEKLGKVIPFHDLTHFAVETVFVFTNAFYGLVSQGWNLADFSTPWVRGELPAEALAAEMIVGVFDLERNLRTGFSASEINEQLRVFCDANGSQPPPPLTDDQIRRVRETRSKLFDQWNALPSGDALEIPFDPCNPDA